MYFNLVNDKDEHEKSVSNLNGTSAVENFYLLTLPILLNACISFWSVNLFQLGLGHIKGNVVINFLAVCVPFICSITIFNQHLDIVIAIIALLSVVAVINSLLLSRANKYNLLLSWRLSQHYPSGQLSLPGRLQFLSQMRGLLLFVSGVCIMAVDVPVFPRRFAKTEWCGLGPMDLGVGLFSAVFGLLESRLPCKGDHTASTKKVSLRGRGKSPMVLVVLGLIRLLTVKVTGYPEHEGEYGRHWNFFFTLAVVRVLAIVMERCTRTRSRVILTLLVVGGLHHALLRAMMQINAIPANMISKNEFNNNIYGSSNTTNSTSDGVIWSLLLANKQGLISLPGYILLWLVGVLVAHCVSGVTKPSITPSRCKIAGLLATLLTLPMAVVFLLLIATWNISPMLSLFSVTSSVSRRFANIPYVIWTSASLCWCLFALLGVDLLLNWLEDRANYVTRTDFPDVLCLINSQAMLHFLTANVATGLVNMSINTLHLSPIAGVGLVLVHTATAILVVLFVMFSRVRGAHCSPESVTNSHTD